MNKNQQSSQLRDTSNINEEDSFKQSVSEPLILKSSYLREEGDLDRHLSSMRLTGHETGRKLLKAHPMNNSRLKQSVNTDDHLQNSIISLDQKSDEFKQTRCQKFFKKLKSCICNFGQVRQNQQFQVLDIKQKSVKTFQEIIHDNGKIDYNQNKKHNQIELTRIQRFKNTLFQVIEPENKYLLMWEILMFFAIWFYFLIIPLEIFIWSFIKPEGYDNQNLHYFEYDINALIIFVLVIDCIIYFNVAFYHEGFIQNGKSEIRKNYYKSGQFLINILGICVPINDMFSEQKGFVFLNLIFFLKLANIIKFNNKIIRILSLKRKSKFTYQMVRLLLMIFYIGHIVACLYFGYSYQIFINARQKDPTIKSWLVQNNIQNTNIFNYLQTDWWIAYGWTLYWSLTTLVSGGYGDIGTPQNIYEAIFVIFVDTFIYVSFAFFMNVIWDYISEYRIYNEKFNKQKNAINRFMKVKEIEHHLQVKIDAYMDYFLKSAREEDQEIHVINKLAPKLQEDLIFDSNGYVLCYTPWIRNNFSEGFLKILAKKMEEINFMHNDLIIDCKNTDEDDIALYFVESGKVEGYFDLPKYNHDKGVPLGLYRAGDMFNTYFFIINQPNKQSFRALEQTTLYKITRKDFILCLEGLQDDKEKFYQIYNQVLFQEDLSVINYSCRMCDDKTHISSNCPQIVFKVNTQELAKQNQGEPEKKRKKITRKKFIYRSLISLFQTHNAHMIFQGKYFPHNEEEQENDQGYESDENVSNLEEDEVDDFGLKLQDSQNKSIHYIEGDDEQQQEDLKKSKGRVSTTKTKNSHSKSNDIFQDEELMKSQEQQNEINQENIFIQGDDDAFLDNEPQEMKNNIQNKYKKKTLKKSLKILNNESKDQIIKEEEEKYGKIKEDDLKLHSKPNFTQKSFQVEYKENEKDDQQSRGKQSIASSFAVARKQNKNQFQNIKNYESIDGYKFKNILTPNDYKFNNKRNTSVVFQEKDSKDGLSENNSQIRLHALQRSVSQINTQLKFKQIQDSIQAKKKQFQKISSNNNSNSQQFQSYIQYQQAFNENLMNHINDLLLKKNYNQDNDEYDQYDQGEYNVEQQTNNQNEPKSRNINFNIDKIQEFKHYQTECNIQPLLTQITKLQKQNKKKKQQSLYLKTKKDKDQQKLLNLQKKYNSLVSPTLKSKQLSDKQQIKSDQLQLQSASINNNLESALQQDSIIISRENKTNTNQQIEFEIQIQSPPKINSPSDN